MDEREKLTKTLKDSIGASHRNCPRFIDLSYSCTVCKYNRSDGRCDSIARVIDELIKRNVVVLPCKVNDDVIVLNLQYYDTECNKPHYLVWRKKFKYGLLDSYKLGETLFLTEEAAMEFVQKTNGTVNKPTFEHCLPDGTFMCGETH